jgi:hypothetical protein
MKRFTLSQQFMLLAFSLSVFVSHSALALTQAQKDEVKIGVNQNTGPEFLITVDLKKQRYRFATFIQDFESPVDGLAKQRTLMGWKGDYLFVRHQAGSTTPWRRVVDQVFTRTETELIHLGAIESADCKELGCRYDPATGIFRDIYDIHQVNPVTGDSDTPPLPISRRTKGRELVADTQQTWEMNNAIYQSAIACLDNVASAGFGQPCDNKLTPWTALVFAAKLTHYAGKAAERKQLFEKQAVAYCEKSVDPRCKWRIDGVQDFFSRFEVGALPDSLPSPITLTSSDATEPKTRVPEKMEFGTAVKLKL